MTKSNRTLNRIVLLVLGLLAIVVGVVVGAGVLPAVRDALRPSVELPASVDVPTSALWTVAVACLVVVVLALLWASTRGRGGTAVAVRETTGDSIVTVNVSLLRDLVSHELEGVRDVVGAKVDVFSVRRSEAARIRVSVRRGGDAVAALEAADRVVAVLDETLGRRLPVLVHLTGGTRSVLAGSSRVR